MSRAVHAREVILRGFLPIPVPKGQKAPVLSGWQTFRRDGESYTRTIPADASHPDGPRIVTCTLDQLFADDGNQGNLNGRASGLADVDHDCAETRALSEAFLPPTGLVHGRPSSPRSHPWYALDGPCKRLTWKDPLAGEDRAMLLELRGDKSQTLLPPSIHPSGEVYQWDSDGEPARVDVDTLVLACNRLASASLLGRHWPHPGSRHDTTLAIAGWLLHMGVVPDSVVKVIAGATRVACDDELADRARCVEDTIARFERGEPVTGRPSAETHMDRKVLHAVEKWLGVGLRASGGPHARHATRRKGDPTDSASAFARTELGLAERLIHRYGADLCYVPGWGWLYWDGSRWVRDQEDLHLLALTQETVRSIYAEAQGEPDHERRSKLAKFAAESETARRMRAAIDLARARPGVAAFVRDFDADPWLLNTPNSTLDLRSGMVRPQQREDLITHQTGVEFKLGTSHKEWDRTLTDVFAGESATISYLKRQYGSMLVGGNSDQVLLLESGSGANGKFTINELIRRVLGTYAAQVSAECFVQRPSDGPRPELARLPGVRVVFASELGANRRLDEALVKTLTGSEAVTVRALYANPITYIPAFTPILATNQRPVIRGQEHGIWRRLRCVEYPVRFVDHPAEVCPPYRLLKDANRAARLEAAMSGILAWLVEGCLEWQRDGLNPPTSVLNATSAYRQSMDALGEFFESRCIFGPSEEEQATSLFRAYTDFTQATGGRPVSLKAFGTMLTERDIGARRDRTGVIRVGIGLRRSRRPDASVNDV